MDVVMTYIMPTEPDLPPRALLFQASGLEVGLPGVELSVMTEPVTAIWSTDLRCWMVGATALPPDLDAALTKQAKKLGVEW